MPFFGRNSRGASAQARLKQSLAPLVSCVFSSPSQPPLLKDIAWSKEQQRLQAEAAAMRLWNRCQKAMIQGALAIDRARPLSPAPLARSLEDAAGMMPPYQDWVVLDLNAPSRSARSGYTASRMPPFQDWVVLDPNAPGRSRR